MIPGVIVKCLGNILIPFFGASCVWGWRNIPPIRARFFVRKKYTTFITQRIVALWYNNVNNIFPESYGFAATITSAIRSHSQQITLIIKKRTVINLISPIGNANQRMGDIHGPLNISEVGSGAMSVNTQLSVLKYFL
jgi:hypothetical protein